MLIFKGLRNRVISELRQAKPSFYVHLIGNSKGNGKMSWQNINNIIRKESHSYNDVQLKIEGKLLIIILLNQ